MSRHPRAGSVTTPRGKTFSLFMTGVGALPAVWRLTVHQGVGIVVAMEAVVQNELFPVIEAEARKKSALREFMEVVEREGPLIPRAHIPVVLDLSRERIKQLVDERRIATLWVQDREFVPMASLEAYLAEERKNGRPVREKSMSENFRRVISNYRKNRKKNS